MSEKDKIVLLILAGLSAILNIFQNGIVSDQRKAIEVLERKLLVNEAIYESVCEPMRGVKEIKERRDAHVKKKRH
jgi:hypothetical protein